MDQFAAINLILAPNQAGRGNWGTAAELPPRAKSSNYGAEWAIIQVVN